jgi:D-beta-D-heptose 7-phosphate kinase/D-beta-D-heptose 1-phosphate adenosyltransferase
MVFATHDMHQDSLLDLLGGFGAARILVLGDAMLDRFVYGSVERISPEAPIPVMKIERTADMLGGAANVIRNVAALGSRGTLIGAMGDDVWADSLAEQLAMLPGISSRMLRDAARPTTVKTRYVAERQQVLRADHESSAPLAPDKERLVIDAYAAALGESDVVVLSDYAKGLLSDAVIAAAISAARAAGKTVLVDPKSKSFAKYRGASVLTPNRHELQAASGVPCDTDGEIEAAARRILADHGCDVLVVTRGKDGMSVIKADEPAVHLRATAREVFDVSGAGDTVAAALACGLAAHGEFLDACELANIAAGIVVGKVGTAVATTREIGAALRPFGSRGDLKIYSPENAVRLARDWRAQGLRIAFTNGCFDLIHPGHVSLLDQARYSADRLIVGLNSDDSVRRLKGPARPIQDEVARATILSSLKAVDAVVIFAEDTPLNLIEAVAPDVLVKGADYSADAVVGADFVKARGGRVLLADLVHGESTTNTLQRMATADRK